MRFLRPFLLPLKLLVLLLVGYMAYIQLPEILYDFGPATPHVIGTPGELDDPALGHMRFVSIQGKGNFARAFTYRRYGMDMHYFTLDPYGKRVVVRTYDPITDDWGRMDRFLGRLRPFDRQPFSHYVAKIFEDQFGEAVPGDAYFLALGDVPRPSAWQLGGLALAATLWLGLAYLFFARKWLRR